MTRFLLAALLLLTHTVLAQHKISGLLDAEYEAGHFNGAALVVNNGKVVVRASKGYANLQFGVPITQSTRFPIASMTKTFTAILVLQLVEQSRLRLDDKAAQYVPELPPACQSITILELLTHYSGLQNEPILAYKARYSPTEYVQKFVARPQPPKAPAFNYTNVDYVLLTRVLEVVTQKPFAVLLQERIFSPLAMHDSGLIREAVVTPNLAYGYHNYKFGAGSKTDTIFNDAPIYLSNYAGAGAIYSTPEDVYKLVQGLKAHKLLSASTTTYLTKPQKPTYIDGIRGYPTLGFYFNDKTFLRPC
ncbi:serine hydrolase domain-containing protein [Hymenobacter wooponensis]|uniref:Class A beta-lactamase-related serine hydrolase n=1 Tax=Hymenobacter wooponensis TaxID=1525360 RepID=A0A4Z0MQM7_9BACT|nr:serine hydrolase domain-containing protein [Hymenobacter wooponensis]TGD81536.1 class A beta-lactamase-related serine hydrolase [Hymenobacter wooponensis]